MPSANPVTRPTRLTRSFYRRDAESLARALLGMTLVRVVGETGGERMELRGKIVEVEAYLGVADRAAHTFGGRRTARNEVMYLDAGHAYVYFTYGMHHCLNVTADGAGVPTACLIRAVEPLEGIDRMRANRAGKIAAERLGLTDLCSGPAKLTQALWIDLGQNGVDLTVSGELYVTRGERVAASRIVSGPRVGVESAGEWAAKPLRFWIRGNPHVSRG